MSAAKAGGKRPPAAPAAEPLLPAAFRLPLLAVLLSALALRLFYVLRIEGDLLSTHLVIDAKFYDAWAGRIAAGRWIGDDVFYQDPLYAYFLAAVYKAIGHTLTGVRLIQACLDTGTVALFYVLGRRLFDPLTGLLGAVMAALLGPMVYYVGLLDKTTVSLFLTTAALALLVEAAARQSARLCAASGAAFGLASLSRGNMILAAAAMALWLLRTRLRQAGAFALSASAVVGLVAARNYLVGRDLVLITANPGLNFFIGNNPYTVGQYIEPPFIRGIPEDEYADAKTAAERFTGHPFEKPSQVSRYWLGQGLDFIRKSPRSWAVLSARKLFLAFNDFEVAETYSFYYFRDRYPLLFVPFLSFGVVASLGVAGMQIFLYRRRFNALVLFGAVYLASLVAFFVTSRYRFPLVTALLPFSAWMLVDTWRERGDIPAVACRCALAAAALALAFWRPGWMKARVVGPTLSTAHTIAGFLYSEQGDFQNGRGELEAAIRANPFAPLNYLYLGDLLLNHGDAAAGTAALERALQLDPQLDLAWERLGVARYNAKDYRSAAAAFQRALALRPSEAAYQSNFNALRNFLPR